MFRRLGAGQFQVSPLSQATLEFHAGDFRTVLADAVCQEPYADSNGQTIVERGSEHFSGGVRTALRILAFVGNCNLSNFVYTSGMGIHAVFADPWPKDMPSWLSDEQYGSVTGKLCPPAALNRPGVR
jgi:hypothetical protein